MVYLLVCNIILFFKDIVVLSYALRYRNLIIYSVFYLKYIIISL